MREVAEHAEKVGVTLAIEFLNRFECYFLNTAADGARFCADVNHPRCKMMYDTFHAHIEEKNIPEAIRALKGHLAHVHISENDRSTPGQGNVRWKENFDTLAEIGYDNLMVIEAFGLALEKLVAATKIWRRMYQSERQLASDGLAFMKAEVAKRWKK
jgi:D-psicose/D-tagatose/L-ribulose 3-epimerase